APYRVRVSLKLHPESGMSASEVARKWRDANGEIVGATSVRFDYNLMPTTADIYINLFHEDLDVLQRMASELQWLLSGYQGVHEVSNNLAAQREIMEVMLRPAALDLGLTQEYLALQVRDAFHGIEIDRLAEQDREVPVLLELAQSDANTL